LSGGLSFEVEGMGELIGSSFFSEKIAKRKNEKEKKKNPTQQ
jgi:hypothetical protein